MTQDQIVLFALFAMVFAALVSGRWRYDAVAFTALLAAVLLGVVPPASAFEGFGHPATLVVALVLVVSAGLTRAGVVLAITRRFVRPGRSLGGHIAMMGAIGGLLSAFMNNVAALAILMPVDVSTARQEGRSPARTLMPLSFATILGGMVTLIGTPPNIIVATIRQDTLGAPFAMFDYAPVGGIVALAGLVFVALAGWRLIPLREDADARPELAAFVAELVISEDSAIAGKTVGTLQDEADRAGATLVAVIRDGRARSGLPPETELCAGDVLRFEAGSEALDALRAGLGLDFADQRRKHYLEAERAGLVMVQAAVPAGARIVGKSAESVGLIWRQGTALMGISRQGRGIRGPLRKATVRAGDVLLLLAPQEDAAPETPQPQIIAISETTSGPDDIVIADVPASTAEATIVQAGLSAPLPDAPAGPTDPAGPAEQEIVETEVVVAEAAATASPATGDTTVVAAEQIGVPHLPSPDNPPPGTSAEPVGPASNPNVSYLKELWSALKNQEIDRNDLLVALAQRSFTAPVPGDAATPAPDLAAAPTEG